MSLAGRKCKCVLAETDGEAARCLKNQQKKLVQAEAPSPAPQTPPPHPAPSRKIFTTQSQRATSSPSISLQTMLRSDTAGLLLSRNTLHTQARAHGHTRTHTHKRERESERKKKRLQIHRCAATVKNSLRIISLRRQEFGRCDL